MMNIIAWIGVETTLTIQGILSYRWRGMLSSGKF
jgi:hypothetical protein